MAKENRKEPKKRKDLDNVFPPGWDQAKVAKVIEHYNNQSEWDAVVEDNLSTLKHIVMDDNICHGVATFRGTRVTVESVMELLEGGVTREEVMKEYPTLTTQALEEAMELLEQAKEETDRGGRRK